MNLYNIAVTVSSCECIQRIPSVCRGRAVIGAVRPSDCQSTASAVPSLAPTPPSPAAPNSVSTATSDQRSQPPRRIVLPLSIN